MNFNMKQVQQFVQINSNITGDINEVSIMLKCNDNIIVHT